MQEIVANTVKILLGLSEEWRLIQCWHWQLRILYLYLSTKGVICESPVLSYSRGQKTSAILTMHR